MRRRPKLGMSIIDTPEYAKEGSATWVDYTRRHIALQITYSAADSLGDDSGN